MSNKEDKQGLLLSDAQLSAELNRCEYCEEKPCREACPVDCSPADFIMAARKMAPQDILRSAAKIMASNPLGGICGSVCPDKHCMAECSRKLFDKPINIPDVQAEIVYRAKELGGIPDFNKPEANGKKIAVIGAGPAGLGAAAVLAQKGYKIDIFEARGEEGGMCNLIPQHRLNRDVLKTDIEFLKSLGDITVNTGSPVEDPKELLEKDYKSVIVTAGLWKPITMGIPGEELAVNAVDYLTDPLKYDFKGKIAVIGGGASALDCAVIAKKNGAENVEMFSLESFAEMPLTERERNELLEYGIEISGRSRVTAIKGDNGSIGGIDTVKINLNGEQFNLEDLEDIEG
ncbi:FAD-dependent oxidoreductase, partial [Elusimicrobiota bacterium]